MFTNLIKLQNKAYFKKNQLTTHNSTDINNTFPLSHEMSIALIYRPLNFCVLMQHTRSCYIVGYATLFSAFRKLITQEINTCSVK